MNSWLKLYGYDIGNMIGSSYTRTQLHQPSAKVSSPQLTPQFNVVSGLKCIVEKVIKNSYKCYGYVILNCFVHFFSPKGNVSVWRIRIHSRATVEDGNPDKKPVA